MEPLFVMPGYYDVGIRFNNRTIDGLASETDSVLVKINGTEFKVKGIKRSLHANDDAFAVQDLYIPGQYEPVTVEIHLYPTTETSATAYRAWRRIQVGLTRLSPTVAESNFM